jgi:hypothetical protein
MSEKERRAEQRRLVGERRSGASNSKPNLGPLYYIKATPAKFVGIVSDVPTRRPRSSAPSSNIRCIRTSVAAHRIYETITRVQRLNCAIS